MKPITRTFKLEKATKNTHRYQEQEVEGEPIAIGGLYVQKWAAGSPPADELEVTLKATSK